MFSFGESSDFRAQRAQNLNMWEGSSLYKKKPGASQNVFTRRYGPGAAGGHGRDPFSLGLNRRRVYRRRVWPSSSFEKFDL